MKDSEANEVVAVQLRPCRGNREHVSGLLVKRPGAGETPVREADAIELIKAGAIFYMVPPPGAPARAAYEATGLPLLVQTRHCELCDAEVLFA